MVLSIYYYSTVSINTKININNFLYVSTLQIWNSNGRRTLITCSDPSIKRIGRLALSGDNLKLIASGRSDSIAASDCTCVVSFPCLHLLP